MVSIRIHCFPQGCCLLPIKSDLVQCYHLGNNSNIYFIDKFLFSTIHIIVLHCCCQKCKSPIGIDNQNSHQIWQLQIILWIMNEVGTMVWFNSYFKREEVGKNQSQRLLLWYANIENQSIVVLLLLMLFLDLSWVLFLGYAKAWKKVMLALNKRPGEEPPDFQDQKRIN